MTDVRLFQTNDGGEISMENGIVEMDDGRYTAVYLALFGGNEDDPGGEDTTLQWWGNLLDVDSVRKYRSRTQHVLEGLPATTGNLKRILEAVTADLADLVEGGYLETPEISVSIPKVNSVTITIEIPIGVLEYTVPWEGPA